MFNESKQSILVADDDPKTHGKITGIMSDEFIRLKIHSAFDSAGAIEILENTGNKVIGVLTDTRMEDPTAGVRVIETAQRLNPKPVTCIMSSVDDNETAQGAGADFVTSKTIPEIDISDFVSAVRKKIEEE